MKKRGVGWKKLIQSLRDRFRFSKKQEETDFLLSEDKKQIERLEKEELKHLKIRFFS
jgi:hypothetical protein